MPIGFKSRNQLVGRALEILGVLPAGQSPATEDFNKINDQVMPTLATLAAMEIIEIEDPELIPEEAYNQVAAFLAIKGVLPFGLSVEEKARVDSERDQAEFELRLMQRDRPTYSSATPDYF